MEVKRNNGLDICRVLSMCGIIGLHVMNAGGVIANTDFLSVQGILMRGLIVLFYPVVNIFGMMTGWLYISKKEVKNKNLITPRGRGKIKQTKCKRNKKTKKTKQKFQSHALTPPPPRKKS